MGIPIDKSEAYINGYNAYWNGESFLDNPYEPLTIEYEDWQEGWSDNRKVDEEM